MLQRYITNHINEISIPNNQLITKATTLTQLLPMANNTHTHLTALFSGTSHAGTRKVKPIWILQWHSWAICKSASCSKQMTMPAPHHSVFTG